MIILNGLARKCILVATRPRLVATSQFNKHLIMKRFSFHTYWTALLAAAVFSGSAFAGVTVPNDDFADATSLSGTSGTTTGDNTGAT
jgi:hypothetical protein